MTKSARLSRAFVRGSGFCPAQKEYIMNSEIKVFAREDGQIQRVHVVRFDNWLEFEFLKPKANKKALQCFYDIYKNFLIPTMPWIFPQMVMFQLPEKIEIPLEPKSGACEDMLLVASKVLQNGVKLRGGKPVFSTIEAKALWKLSSFSV